MKTLRQESTLALKKQYGTSKKIYYDNTFHEAEKQIP